MTRAPQGRSLELFFIDGKPDGMQTAEESNWTGHVLLTPRTRIADALKRKKAQYTGVYLLLGDGETGEPMLYVGESENMADRIRGHDTKKRGLIRLTSKGSLCFRLLWRFGSCGLMAEKMAREICSGMA